MNSPSPIAVKMSELAALQAKTVELQKSIEAERTAALRELPAQFGFTNTDDFIAAFRDATRGQTGSAHKNGNGTKRGTRGTRGTRHRADISDERREEIKRWFKAEKGTVLEAAQEFGISPATAQIIKGEAGMVNHR